VEVLVEQADSDRDGTISYSEFNAAIDTSQSQLKVAKVAATPEEADAALEMENRIFSKTMDSLRDEVVRLKRDNGLLETELKSKQSDLNDAVADANRLQLQLRHLRQTKMPKGSGVPVADEFRPSSAAVASERADHLLAGHLFSYKLTDNDVSKLREIHRRTNFGQVTVDKLFEVFKKHAVDGGMNRRQFLSAIDELGNVPSQQRFLFDRFYTLFDRNGDQKVDFGEFAGGLSVLCAGTPANKIELIFSFIDADGDGVLTREELTNFFMTLLVVSKGVKDGTTLDESQIVALETQCSQEVEVLVEQADSDRDGTISYSEFNAAIDTSQSQLKVLLEMFSALEADPLEKHDSDLDDASSAESCNVQ